MEADGFYIYNSLQTMYDEDNDDDDQDNEHTHIRMYFS